MWLNCYGYFAVYAANMTKNTDETYAVIMPLKNLLYFYQKLEFKTYVESIHDFDAYTLRKIP